MTKKKGRRFSKAFKKRDARHYIIFAELCKRNIDPAYEIADQILTALEDAKLV